MEDVHKDGKGDNDTSEYTIEIKPKYNLNKSFISAVTHSK